MVVRKPSEKGPFNSDLKDDSASVGLRIMERAFQTRHVQRPSRKKGLSRKQEESHCSWETRIKGRKGEKKKKSLICKRDVGHENRFLMFYVVFVVIVVVAVFESI